MDRKAARADIRVGIEAVAIAGTKMAPPLDMGLVAATRALAVAGEALDLLDKIEALATRWPVAVPSDELRAILGAS